VGTNFSFVNEKLEKRILELDKKLDLLIEEYHDINPNIEFYHSEIDNYKLHMAKTSCGWKPIFQKTDKYSSLKEMKKFYFDNISDYVIKDEYGDEYSWDDFVERVVDFAKDDLEAKCHSEVGRDCYLDDDGYCFIRGEFS